MKKTIYIKEFSEYPGLRHCSISDDSGEEFYHKVLNHEFKAALDNCQKIVINLDNTAGYAPSFLDEAFGNLVYDFGLNKVQETLNIISEQEPDLKEMIINETYNQWEERRRNNNKPKKTIKHSKWYRLVNGSIVEETSN